MTKITTTLKRPQFWPLFITQALGALNDNVFRTAFITYSVFQLSTLKNTDLSFFSPLGMCLMMLPFFLFSAIAGELADKYRKSSLVKIIKFSELLVLFFGALGFFLGNPYFLLIIIFFMGTQSAFFGPLKYSLLPESLPKNELISANALFGGATFLSIVLGCLIGGTLAGLKLYKNHFIGNYMVAVIVFLIATGGFWAAWQIPDSKTGDNNIKINPKIWQSTTAIIKLAYQQKTIWLCILGLSWFWVMGSIFITHSPALIKDLFNGGPSIYNLLLVTISVGIAIGSISCQWVLKGRLSLNYVPWAALIMAVLLIDLTVLVFSLPTPPETTQVLTSFLKSISGWHLTINLFLISFFGGFYVVPQNAMIQYLAPAKLCSRIIAGNNIINAFFISLASIAGVIFLFFGGKITYIYATMAFFSVLVAFVSLLLLPDHLIRIFCKISLKLIYRVKIEGLKHLNDYQTGPVLLVSNHTSLLDCPLLISAVNRKLTFAINTDWANKWWLGYLLKFVNSISLDPNNPMGTRALLDALGRGEMVVIFPEGRITTTGSLMKIYEGSALLADRGRAPIIPIHIKDAQYSRWGKYGKTLDHKVKFKISATFFPALKIDLNDDLSKRERRHKVSEKLYQILSLSQYKSNVTDDDLWTSLLKTAKRHGKKRKILSDSSLKYLSYGDIIKRSKFLAIIFAKFTKEKEMVGLLLPNINVSALSFFALSASGRIPVMLNYTQGAGPFKIAIKNTKINNIITSRKFIQAAKLENSLKDIPAKITYLEDINITFKDKIISLFFKAKKQNPNAIAEVLFTSGSEGQPKAVLLSHKNILSNISQLLSRVDFNENDKLFNALPFFHSFGLNIGFLLPILSGAKLILYPSPLHRRLIVELIYDQRVTVLISTDTFLQSWGKAAHPYDFFKVRYIFSGAEKTKESTRKLFSEKFGLRIFEGYGVTEAGPVLAINTPMHNSNGTVGQLLSDIEYRLEIIEGLDHSKGHLIVKGPNLMLGYLNYNFANNMETLDDNWYRTGDIVTIDENNYLKIVGRQKRFAKIAGEMISLEAIEQMAQVTWPDTDLAVISVDDERRGEALLLIINSLEAKLINLHDTLKENNWAEISWPKQMVKMEIPITPMGKVNYPLLLEQYNKQIKNQ